jgi:hypothetical protein
MLSAKNAADVGQAIGFCRLPSAVNGSPQKAMACAPV